MIDREVGPFWVLEKCVEGPHGTLYRGVHKTRDQEVAIWDLAPSSFPDPAQRDRFLRNVTFLRRAAPSRIVRIHFCLATDESILLVTDAPTRSVEDRIATAPPMSVGEATRITLAVIEAVRYLHRYRIVHGQISPRTVFLSPEGTVQLGYFGISGIGADDEAARSRPPGEAAGAAPTQGDDLFAIAAAFLAMIGKAPTALQEEGGAFVDRHLRQVLARAMAADPAQRYGSAEEFHHAFTRAAAASADGTAGAEIADAARRFRRRAAALALLFALLLVPIFLALINRQEEATPVGTRLLPAPYAPAPTSIPIATPPAPVTPAQPPAAKPASVSARNAPAPERRIHKKKQVHLAHRKKRIQWIPPERREELPTEKASLFTSQPLPPPQEDPDGWSIRK